MYIHLGNNYVISAPSVIAILNYEPPISNDIRDVVDIARMERTLVNISEKGKEKSVVICDDKVYLSPISSITLYKRAFNNLKEV